MHQSRSSCSISKRAACSIARWLCWPPASSVTRRHHGRESQQGSERIRPDRCCCLAPPSSAALVYGRTADERPCTTIEHPVPMEDLHASIYHALGVAPTTSYVVEKRPVFVTKDGTGKIIRFVREGLDCSPREYRDDALACEFPHEHGQEARLHRLQHARPHGSPDAPQCRAARLAGFRSLTAVPQ
jgi:hypothetical protein